MRGLVVVFFKTSLAFSHRGHLQPALRCIALLIHTKEKALNVVYLCILKLNNRKAKGKYFHINN